MLWYLMSTHNICFSGEIGNHLELRVKFTILQPLYNMLCYNTVLDITQFRDGSQKCIDYIEK